jgi:hypothetical protein
LVLIMAAITDQPLRILHAVRAPVGGIFRHILDLAKGQADRGHHVGIVADSGVRKTAFVSIRRMAARCIIL